MRRLLYYLYERRLLRQVLAPPMPRHVGIISMAASHLIFPGTGPALPVPASRQSAALGAPKA